jgi:hypothetical protein
VRRGLQAATVGNDFDNGIIDMGNGGSLAGDVSRHVLTCLDTDTIYIQESLFYQRLQKRTGCELGQGVLEVDLSGSLSALARRILPPSLLACTLLACAVVLVGRQAQRGVGRRRGGVLQRPRAPALCCVSGLSI